MISESSPSRSSTAPRRRCSSPRVPTSLKSGTTIDRSRSYPRRTLRDMAKSPGECTLRGRQVVANELNGFVRDDVFQEQGRQQLNFIHSGSEESRGHGAKRG